MTMALWALVSVVVVGMLLRMPIGFSMLMAGVAYLLVKGQDLGLVAEQVSNGLYNSYVLLAVPLFVFAANIMNAGTVSGAPKVRAMEIIDELEPVQRGIYGGACGYLSFAGDMDLAIAIRTGIVKDQTLYVQAAAGVVADSVPELEWRETEAKARALLRAAELVEEGLE